MPQTNEPWTHPELPTNYGGADSRELQEARLMAYPPPQAGSNPPLWAKWLHLSQSPAPKANESSQPSRKTLPTVSQELVQTANHHSSDSPRILLSDVQYQNLSSPWQPLLKETQPNLLGCPSPRETCSRPQSVAEKKIVVGSTMMSEKTGRSRQRTASNPPWT